MNIKLILSVFYIFLTIFAYAQEDLLEQLKDEESTEPDYTTATFKSTRVINSHSVETLGKQQLDFRISHRFGEINSGSYELWGLDHATMRFGLEYGITDRFNIGVGRSSFLKTYDGYTKFKLIRQRIDKIWSPVTVVWFSNMAITTLKSEDEYVNSHYSSRLSYTHQLIIARKFSEKLSLQIAPSIVHFNYQIANARNNLIAIEAGGRMKISKRVSLNIDYIYRLNPDHNSPYFNSLAAGVDIETGGHVFQLHVTNSQGMIEQYFIANTAGNLLKGGLYYGFNISRQFSLGRKKL
jgi:hypothetical protein